MDKVLRYFLIFTTFFCAVNISLAQNCGCDYIIPTNVTYIKGDSVDIKPGDVICVMAGVKKNLGLVNFHGTAENPIIVKNCGGQVLLGDPTFYYAIRFDNCTNFIFTGTGDPNTQYGFKTSRTLDGTMGLTIDGLSTDFEVDHLEIAESGFAGIMAKSDPDCTPKADRGNFVMKNVSIHDNYIHDTKGEGIYVGFPHYSGIVRVCNGDSIRKYPHDIHNLKIYNNILENTGREGIQVGCATQNVEIHDNIVKNYGTTEVKYQNAGVQIGTGTVGIFYSNRISGGSGPGIWLKGMGDNFIYNNIIENVNGDGFMVHDSVMNDGTGYYILNNTIVNGSGIGIKVYTERNTKIVWGNNITAGFRRHYAFSNSEVENHNNVFRSDVSKLRFVNAGIGDYQLKAVSPAVDAGYDCSDKGVVVDYEYDYRPQAKAYDAGAFESPFERLYETFQVNPNPVVDDADILFVVLDDTEFKLSIYDELGREVMIIDKGLAIGGEKYIYKFDCGFLAQSMYYFTLTTNEGKKVIKIIHVE